jgi:hypothetical protein
MFKKHFALSATLFLTTIFMKTIKNIIASGFAASVLLFALTPQGFSQQSSTDSRSSVDIPRVLSYQGFIQSSDGISASTNKWDGIQKLTVRLYADNSGKQLLWEDEFSADVHSGVFDLLLGSQKPLPTASEFTGPMWIAVKVGDGDEMKPYTQLTASPYALTVANHSITPEKIAADYVSSIFVNGEKVTGNGTGINFIGSNGLDLNFDPSTNTILVSGSSTGSNGKGGTPLNTSNYINNGTSLQSGASFNIGSNGTIGGSLSLGTALTVGNGGTGSTTASGARSNLGLGSIATQNSNAVTITGGTIDGTSIGATSTSSGAFTTLSTSSSSSFGGALNMNSYAITSLGDPSNAQDAATKNYVDAADATISGNLSNEVTRAEGAESTLTSNLNTEISNRQTAVTDEATARSSADATISGNLSNEVTRAEGAESTLTGNLTTEISNRQTAVTGEATARSSSDATITGNLNNEITRAEGAETALQTNIGAEASARTTAVATVTTNLNSEVTTRTNQATAYLLLDGTRSMTGALNMNSHSIGNVSEPSAAQDAATKNYVDNGITAATGNNYIKNQTGLQSANFNINGNATAASFSGNGANITHVNAETLNGETNANLHDASLLTGSIPNATHATNVSGGAITSETIDNTVTGDGSGLTGVNALTLNSESNDVLHDADNLTGIYASLDGSQILNVDATSLNGEGNVSLHDAGSLTGTYAGLNGSAISNVDAVEVNGDANIAFTDLDNDFGMHNLTTTGLVTSGQVYLSPTSNMDALTIGNSGTGNDISSNQWYVTYSGGGTFNGGISVAPGAPPNAENTIQFNNGAQASLVSASLTDVQTWTLPDNTGTIALLSDIPSVSNYLPLSGGSMTGTIDMGSNSITNVLDPSSAQDAATKNYVDANAMKKWVSVPVSSTASGSPGDVAEDSNYIYICTATNTWKRAALSSW